MSAEDVSAARQCLGLLPSGSYFDVFAFCADQQLVEVELRVDGPSAGLLNKELGVQHLVAGQKMNVPLAAASSLQEEELAFLRIPSYLSRSGHLLNTVHSSFSQEACCLLDLKSICPVFFEFATRVAYLANDQELYSIVHRILRERLKMAAAMLENENAKLESARPSGESSGLAQSSLQAFENSLGRAQQTEQASLTQSATADARKKTFIRGLTLSEARAIELRRQQMRL